MKNIPKYSFKTDELEEVKYKCVKKFLLPNNEQKRILLHWIDLYIKMYNATLNYIKDKRFKKEKITYSYTKLRTEHLKDTKEAIFESSNFNHVVIN